ncbi:ATP-binding protein [Papillibacter cinnamivorans]|uniref:histidine kinase n=1 Tax=Papillibacter cinnamivorans DSM 12816 TaxID=1122930 RepID=A0A1W2CN10_9FIRM|nr:ATP-binding protein [Papillibacter cinnamivorans]SMC86590.1 two-component system, OmpR family, sensor histidine kinase VicK [Papillibacter cinnamivorans DSM 12816]
MFRSLHMKLVLILLLLITSLMTVIGSFLISSVVQFYLDEFYQQMGDAFGEGNASFVADLRSAAVQEDGAERIQVILEANAGLLGINSGSRNYYILNGVTGEFITGSDEEGGKDLAVTPNILTAINGQVGDDSDITASYMDVAVPISPDGNSQNSYIIYILDNRQTVEKLNSELVMIIIEALIFGLVISVLLSFLLAKTMITPIERLTEGTERVAAGDFSHRIEVESGDEIGVLTNTFNHMANVLKETLEEVENERNKLGTLFLHMTDGVVAFSRDGSVIHYNPAAEMMLHRKLEGEKYEKIFGEAARFENLLALEQPAFVEAEQSVAGRSLELFLAPFSKDEAQGGVLVVIHDVTEQRKAEELRREFVANVSHELRTPLTNIRSYAETLAASPDLPPETAESFLEVILRESDRMTHIVQDLLTLSRFDYGRMELKFSWFPFGEAIDNVCRSMQMEAKRHGHKLEKSFVGTLPRVWGDRERLEQVMLNVLSNAVKYTPDGGEIRLTAGTEGESVWMEVTDNGIGIPEEDKDRIFERFYRVDKARSRESGGTGLGLSIAREIVMQHKGTIELVNRPGPGTTVRVTLPIGGKADGSL